MMCPSLTSAQRPKNDGGQNQGEAMAVTELVDVHFVQNCEQTPGQCEGGVTIAEVIPW